MKALAFLQNMWVRDPDRVRALIEKYGERYRDRLIHFALFNGCLTGRRLKAAFGARLCSEIIWEEASPEIACEASGCPPADPAHIRAALERHSPDVVLCFGKIATDAVRPLWKGALIIAPHPAARSVLTFPQLTEAARSLAAARENHLVSTQARDPR